MSRPKHLPRTDALMVEANKVTGYLLNLDHEVGGAKAKFFRNRGFKPEAWLDMAEALRQHGATQPVTKSTTTMFGKKFEVQCQILTPDGKNPCILTAWIVEGDKPPRLVTAHPNH